jgi:hypothetical protein
MGISLPLVKKNNSSNKKTKIQLKNGQNTLTNITPRQTYRGQIGI